MKAYILRRLLLMPLTLLGVTLVVFSITRLMPGGPIEQMLQKKNTAASSSGKASSPGGASSSIGEEDLERLEEQFGLNANIFTAWLQWLGVTPRETPIYRAEFTPESPDSTRVVLGTSGLVADVSRSASASPAANAFSTVFSDASAHKVSGEGWHIRIESPLDRALRSARRQNISDPAEISALAEGYAPRAVAFREEFSGLLQGSFGNSFKYNEPVWTMMTSRIPVTFYFGLLSALVTYAVCIPLGIVKAIRHRSFLDNLSSVLIFAGYAIPGFALGAILLVFLGARLSLFPLYGLTSADFPQLSFPRQILDIAWHTVLPLACYTIGSFAFLTMMVKNSLMDHLSADYVRTAMAKGASFRGAVFGHALRNSFIPVATSLGNLVSLLVAGSLLVERVFDIPGFGLLNFQAVVDKDYPLVMGTLTLSAALLILGNLLSDIIVCFVDPRIRMGGN